MYKRGLCRGNEIPCNVRNCYIVFSLTEELYESSVCESCVFPLREFHFVVDQGIIRAVTLNDIPNVDHVSNYNTFLLVPV